MKSSVTSVQTGVMSHGDGNSGKSCSNAAGMGTIHGNTVGMGTETTIILRGWGG